MTFFRSEKVLTGVPKNTFTIYLSLPYNMEQMMTINKSFKSADKVTLNHELSEEQLQNPNVNQRISPSNKSLPSH